MKASAPGKLMLFGEYAVLEGAPALVMAVNRRAQVELKPSAEAGGRLSAPQLAQAPIDFAAAAGPVQWDCGPDLRSELALADRLIQALHEERRIEVHVDTGPFFQSGHKLGLGSSAAMTVAWVAAALGSASLPQVRDRALTLHRGFQQGRGSGADIAASAHGGVLSYRPKSAPLVRPLAWPRGLHWAALWTGRSVSTRDYLQRLADFRRDSPARYGRCLESLAELAADAVAAFERGDSVQVVDLAARYAESLSALGKAADIEIVCELHRPLVSLAVQSEVAYKPSGAGGGDIGIALARSSESLNRFIAAASKRGALPLDLAISRAGVLLHP